MKYSELFLTIQGEGELTGVPSVFFRTSYCNLRCHWCDTPYTSWKPENKDISIDEAIEQITDYNCKHIVITGGEPFVQTKDLSLLTQHLTEKNHHITIETNATIYDSEVKADLISMSPKLHSSGPNEEEYPKWAKKHERLRYNTEAIRQFLENYHCQIKFVVESPNQFQEIEELIEKTPLPRELVVLMPEGVTKEAISDKQEWLVEYCKEKGYRYSDRLHVAIYGKRRGV